ncbi:hypothetical protein CVT24_001870 [Panaeolus cyanescens]|uniref:Cytochrome P450 n=1 Tax=Panaeolus cyanescens TaxID=181874 RepID=A0A409YEM8_9AGAR|nr:hypothetical protein CVT24_001870 [Panaeolus cyanescens]
MSSASFISQYPYHLLVGCFLAITLFKRLGAKKRNPNNLPYPPGPKGYPLIGSLFDMPKGKPWLEYHEWSKTYGDMIYFEVLGQPFLVLGSLERANDIFEKRSSNYSDRMRMPMINELMGHDGMLAFQRYGPVWKKHRRAFQEQFHPQVIGEYQPVHVREVRAFLQRLLETPKDFYRHIDQSFGATILKVAYGYTIQGHDDPLVLNIEDAMDGIKQAGHPGAFLVDLIPAMKYIPEWFPGATFQKKAARWRQITQDMTNKPFEYVKEQMKNGTAIPCISTKMIDQLPDENDPSRAEQEQLAKRTASAAYLAGADSTLSAVKTFFLAMILYPEAQRRAQEELDSVLCGRLPEFSDRDSLPYINALVNENLRWKLVTNVGFPHVASQDDEYNGYFIPKGTLLIANAWAALHDPEVFENPDEFLPERYLDKDGQLDHSVRSPSVAAFGFGRRKCPGRHFSNDGLFMMIASTLAVYNILPPLDSNGKPCQLTAEFTSEVVSTPLPFECRIVPRSSAANTLIQDCLTFE